MGTNSIPPAAALKIVVMTCVFVLMTFLSFSRGPQIYARGFAYDPNSAVGARKLASNQIFFRKRYNLTKGIHGRLATGGNNQSPSRLGRG
jgi:hypothetical protein